MVPVSYLAVQNLPKTSSGKLDRKALRTFARALPDDAFSPIGEERDILGPRTETETLLQKAWSEVMSLPQARIGRNSHFFRLGGDSMAAIRLVAALRQVGASLTAEHVLANPVLEAQAAALSQQSTSAALSVGLQVPAPFSLLRIGDDDQRSRLLKDISAKLNLDAREVEDVLPASPMQEGLWALSARRRDAYLSKTVFTLPQREDVERLQDCFAQAAHYMPILRTTLFTIAGEGTFQVVLKVAGSHALSRTTRAGTSVEWSIHHALYDAATWNMILETVGSLFERRRPGTYLPYSLFVQHLQEREEEAASSREYWRSELCRERMITFPAAVPGHGMAKASCAHAFDFPRPEFHSRVPFATLLHAGFATLLARHANSLDVVFGSVRSGRTASARGIDLVAGPTIAVVPLHVRVEPDAHVGDFLQMLQQQSVEMIPHEHLGLSNIKACLPDAFRAQVDFQALLAVQPPQLSEREVGIVPWHAQADEAQEASFFTYPLNVLVTPREHTVHVHVQFDPSIIKLDRVKQLGGHYRQICESLTTASADTPCRHIALATDGERGDILAKRREDPASAARDGTVHGVADLVAGARPDVCAVSGWDGSLTYRELQTGGDVIARALRLQGVQKGESVGVCADKGHLVPLAVLAILKAAARFVLLDRSLPRVRLASILRQAEVRVVLSPAEHHAALEPVVPGLVVLCPHSLLATPQESLSHVSLPAIDGSDDAYLVFTSGTTGTAKGIRISHRALLTSLHYHSQAIGLTETARVLQYSRYNWDVSILELLAPLMLGARLCIPPASATLSPLDLERFIDSERVSCLILTPSVARLIRPAKVPSISHVALTGEPMSDHLRRKWVGRVRLTNCYGPAECTPLSSVSVMREDSRSAHSLQSGRASVLWVVEPGNPELLTPPGLTSELLIEGPIVGSGYLTLSSVHHSGFVEGPQWLQRLRGRRTSVYLTGDLVEHGLAGSLHFAGRKDLQFKINGQRVELTEVEAHLKSAIPHLECAVDTVDDPADRDKSILAAFICCSQEASTDHRSLTELIVPDEIAESVHNFSALIKAARATLITSLQSFMIPRLYVPLASLPLSSTGKLDRRTLRSLDASHFLHRARQAHQRAMPQGVQERRMRDLWSLVLKLDETAIGRDDDFFMLGGDSLKAMQLASTDEYQECAVGVSDIMGHPTIREHGALVEARHSKKPATAAEGYQETSVVRQRILGPSREMAAKVLGKPPSEIDDIYPCTPLQSGLVALSSRNPKAYWARFTLKEQLADRDLDRFRNVWASVESLVPVLRTRIILGDGDELVQVILREGCSIQTLYEQSNEVETYPTPDVFLTEGTPLVHCSFTRMRTDWNFQLTIHHSIYDLWFLGLLSDLAGCLFQGKLPSPVLPFRHFVDTISAIDVAACRQFWQSSLSGANQYRWPPRSAAATPMTDALLKNSFNMPRIEHGRFTSATIVRTAWALLLSYYNDSDNAIYGEVLSGRMYGQAMRTAGPTLATVPVKAAVGLHNTTADLMMAVQKHYLELIPFHQAGLQHIARMLPECDKHVVDFGTLIVINSNEYSEGERANVWDWSGEDANTAPQHPYLLAVECNIGPSSLEVNIAYDSRVMNGIEVNRVSRQLAHIFSQLRASDHSTPPSDFRTAPSGDMVEILQWNAEMPPYVEDTLHGLVGHQAARIPNEMAVDAWDGRLTFRELERASDLAAQHLLQSNCRASTPIAFLFEKSRLAIVAMLAILKAGAAFVPLDPSQPPARLKTILDQAKVEAIISSSAHVPLAKSLRLKVFTVDGFVGAEAITAVAQLEILVDVPPTDVACILFTSGSTGLPKGIMLEHRNLATSISLPRERLFRPKPSRFLQFSAFTFDVSVDEIFRALAAGDCVCVPSDLERLNSLEECFKKYAITEATLTPSIAEILDPTRLPDLHVLHLGGEPMRKHHAAKWAPHIYVTNGYGPAECSVIASVTRVEDDKFFNSSRIGRPTNCVHWVVDPDDQNTLVPIGTVGELILEGPIVGRGYINSEQTAKAFLDPPPDWAKAITRPRTSRFYKTGDLVRYDWEGTLLIEGRKDGQMKLNGQRIETDEVEALILRVLPADCQVAVAIVQSDQVRPFLCAFMAPTALIEDTGTGQIPMSLFNALKQALVTSLPAYMVPSRFKLLEALPRTVSGKLNVRKLQSTDVDSISGSLLAPSTTKPLSPIAQTLRNVWSHILKLPSERIAADDSFFAKGGDSISAMRLAANARSLNIALTVAQIFQHPTLEAMASIAKEDAQSQEIPSIAPFSLIKARDKGSVCQAAAEMCQVDVDHIEDIYPCTALQEGVMIASQINPRAYVSRREFQLPHTLDIARFITALDDLVRQRPILRTRIIVVGGIGTYQVVLRCPVCQPSTGLQKSEEAETSSTSLYATALNRFLVAGHTFTWIAHHATYDAHSARAVERDIVDAYYGRELHSGVAFRDFIKHLEDDADNTAAQAFWKGYLADCNAPTWRLAPSQTHMRSSDGRCSYKFRLSGAHQSHFTDFTYFKAAWAILIAQYTGVSDTLFATILSGRDTAMPNAESVLGPSITTIPVRIDCEPTKTIEELMAQVQTSAADLWRFQHTGLAKIKDFVQQDFNLSAKALTLLVMQDATLAANSNLEQLGISESSGNMPDLREFPIVIECCAHEHDGELRIQFDTGLLSEEDALRVVRQMAHIVSRLRSARTGTELRQVDLVSQEDRVMITDWAGTEASAEDAPHPYDRLVSTAEQYPDASAVDAWDGKMSYRDLEAQVASMAHCLACSELTAGSVVALCFKKSKAVIVTMYAIWRLGATFTSLNFRDPPARLKSLAHHAGAKLLVTNVKEFQDLLDRTLYLDGDISPQHWASDRPSVEERQTCDSRAYILYTSGTTGTPKGVEISQKALSTWVSTAGPALMLDHTSRTVQLTRLSFDPSICEIVATLYHRGCVCVPREEECLDYIFDTISEYQVTWSWMTPSVLAAQQPVSSTTLKTLLIGGEPHDLSVLAPWIDKIPIWNAYGPTEGCVLTTCDRITFSSRPNVLGQPFIGRFWIANLSNATLLAPIACVGELLMEGPMLADGYWQDPEKTRAAFVEVPTSWPLTTDSDSEVDKKRLYRTGDLANYLSDGSIRLRGRADTQVKVSGTRIELLEVETWLGKSLAHRAPELAGIVDLVPFQNTTHRYLTVFVVAKSEDAMLDVLSSNSRILRSSTAALQRPRLLEELQADMEKRLPAQMIPSCLLHLSRIPLTTIGKRDRRKLAALAKQLSVEAARPIDEWISPQNGALNELEHELSILWKEALGLRDSPLHSMSSFFKCGGDSIAAMRLVALVRKRGMSINVVQILSTPLLKDMVTVLKPLEGMNTVVTLRPFDMVDDDALADIRDAVRVQSGLDWGSIEDVYPLTGMQLIYYTASLKSPGDGVAQFVFSLTRGTNTLRLQQAIQTVLRTHEALRARFFACEAGIFQAICCSEIGQTCQVYSLPLPTAQAIEARAMRTTLGAPLCRFAIVHPEGSSRACLVWSGHHGIYDGWSIQNLMKALRAAYSNPARTDPAEFKMSQLVHQSLTCRKSPVSAAFWKDHLSLAFPRSPLTMTAADGQAVTARSQLEVTWPVGFVYGGVTLSAMLHVALAMALRSATGSPRPVISTTLTGRGSSKPGINDFIGAAITVVPLCVTLEDADGVRDLSLLSVMRQTQDLISSLDTHGHFGYEAIAQLNETTRAACTSATGLVVHPASYTGPSMSAEDEGADGQRQDLGLQLDYVHLVGERREPLSIECTPVGLLSKGDASITVQAFYDRDFLSDGGARDLMEKFEESFLKCLNAQRDL